jgi:hypothetical protein
MTSVSTADWIYFGILILLFLLSIHQAWENLINKRVSKYAIDGWLFWFSEKFRSKDAHSRVKNASRDPQRLIFLGVFALLVLIGSAQRIYEWVVNNF